MKDSVVVVTGGGRGIGRAICEGFATQGARVMATSRDEAALQETKTIIESHGGVCEVHSADISDEASMNALVEATCSKWGRIDVMVNCAGVAPLHLIEELSPDRFDGMNAVNIRGVYLGSRAVWPVMKKQSGGVIISLSSQASIDPFPGFSAYGATKAWVNAWPMRARRMAFACSLLRPARWRPECCATPFLIFLPSKRSPPKRLRILRSCWLGLVASMLRDRRYSLNAKTMKR